VRATRERKRRVRGDKEEIKSGERVERGGDTM
jgi:hypothetical protein